jgi:hypothetical protein
MSALFLSMDLIFFSRVSACAESLEILVRYVPIGDRPDDEAEASCLQERI